MAETYHISHTRLYSLKGGIVRYKYGISNLKEALDAETQFVARNLKNQDGQPDTDKASGPDDMEFLLRALKSASETFDGFIPKYIKPSDVQMIVYSDQEITITLAESGHTSKTIIGQVYELMRSFLLNFILQLWYQKSGVEGASQTSAGLAMHARQSILRVLMHSFIVRRMVGSRYPVISLSDIRLPLQGKFLGSHRTTTARDAVYVSPEAADIAYVESEADYTIYNGATWEKLADAIDSAATLDAEDQDDYPSDSYAVAGKIYSIIRSGRIGEYEDLFYAGDALLCIRDNTDDDYKNTLENFIAIGSINQV